MQISFVLFLLIAAIIVIASKKARRERTKLTYISEIPYLYSLKIDKSIVDELMCKDPQTSKSLIRGIVAFALVHNLKVVAEGVEHDLQLDFLINEKVEFFQGFHKKLSRPLQQSAFEKQFINLAS